LQFPNTETLGEFLMRDVSHAKGTCAVIILTQFGEYLKRAHGEKVLTNNIFSILDCLTETSVDR
jgi:hypothetical protein